MGSLDDRGGKRHGSDGASRYILQCNLRVAGTWLARQKEPNPIFQRVIAWRLPCHRD